MQSEGGRQGCHRIQVRDGGPERGGSDGELGMDGRRAPRVGSGGGTGGL